MDVYRRKNYQEGSGGNDSVCAGVILCRPTNNFRCDVCSRIELLGLVYRQSGVFDKVIATKQRAGLRFSSIGGCEVCLGRTWSRITRT